MCWEYIKWELTCWYDAVLEVENRVTQPLISALSFTPQRDRESWAQVSHNKPSLTSNYPTPCPSNVLQVWRSLQALHFTLQAQDCVINIKDIFFGDDQKSMIRSFTNCRKVFIVLIFDCFLFFFSVLSNWLNLNSREDHISNLVIILKQVKARCEDLGISSILGKVSKLRRMILVLSECGQWSYVVTFDIIWPYHCVEFPLNIFFSADNRQEPERIHFRLFKVRVTLQWRARAILPTPHLHLLVRAFRKTQTICTKIARILPVKSEMADSVLHSTN